MGVQAVELSNTGHADHPADAEIDHIHCDEQGCRVQCQRTNALQCRVTARCCKMARGPPTCYNAPYQDQPPNKWGKPSYCAHRDGYRAVALARLDLFSSRPEQLQGVEDFHVGWHYARALCHAEQHTESAHPAPACAVQARCCKAGNEQRLHCVHGSRGEGEPNAWGTWSVCPPAYSAVSLERVYSAAHPSGVMKNVAKYECKSDAENDFEGCRAWGLGVQHSTWAKCCRVIQD